MDIRLRGHTNQIKTLSLFLWFRFVCLVAGRRWGKTETQALFLLGQAMKLEHNGYDVREKEVWFIAPTWDQAMVAVWAKLMRIGSSAGIISSTIRESDGDVKLINGRWIRVRGSKNENALRGPGLSAVGIDENATMSPNTWPAVVRPMLTDCEGLALFTGTLQGANHFYQLQQSIRAGAPGREAWAERTFPTRDNPFISAQELADARADMSEAQYLQEYECQIVEGALAQLDVGQLRLDPCVREGSNSARAYLGVHVYDRAEDERSPELVPENESALVVVLIDGDRHHVAHIETGRIPIGKLLVRAFALARQYNISEALMPLELSDSLGTLWDEQSHRVRLWVEPVAVDLPWPRMPERYVTNALQARLNRGRLSVAVGEARDCLAREMQSFPQREDRRAVLSALTSINAGIDLSMGDLSLGEQEQDDELIDEGIGY